MNCLTAALEGCGSGDGQAGYSPRLLRRATPSARGFGSAWFLGVGFGLDFFANSTEVLHYFSVRKANHAHTELLEGCGTSSVSSQSFWGEVLRAVEFNDQFERRAVEVSNVLRNGALPHPTHGLVIQKPIPKLALRRGERPPQLLRPRRQPFVVRQPSHQPILSHPHPRNPLPEGVAPRQRAGGASRPPPTPSPFKARGQS